MKKFVCLMPLILVLAALTTCTKPDEQSHKPKVAATIFPLHDIIRNIAGDELDVVLILPPGASPHTFELTPQEVRRLEGTRIVFKIGHGLDDWTSGFAGFLQNEQTVAVDEGISLIYGNEENDEENGGHAHGGPNPHYWLSVENARIIAGNVARKLIQFDPANEETYQKNLSVYEEELKQLQSDLKQELEPYKGGNLITFHDSFTYYAKEFGLNVVGTIEPFPGKQPTPRYLADLQQKVQQYQIRALFIEPQLSSESVEAFVSDQGLRLYTLDPLGGVQGRDSFIQLMRYNTNTIVEALSHG